MDLKPMMHADNHNFPFPSQCTMERYDFLPRLPAMEIFIGRNQKKKGGVRQHGLPRRRVVEK